MPRRYRRRIVVRPKKRWATNFTNFTSDLISVAPNAPGGFATNLVQNAVQTSNPTPVVLKTGNFKIQGDVSLFNATGQAGSLNLCLYVMFLPQGIDILNGTQVKNMIELHPEWILTWKLVDIASLNSNAQNGFSFSSRLKRNLQSGDRVALLALAETDLTLATPQQLKVHAQCQYWTTTA